MEKLKIKMKLVQLRFTTFVFEYCYFYFISQKANKQTPSSSTTTIQKLCRGDNKIKNYTKMSNFKHFLNYQN